MYVPLYIPKSVVIGFLFFVGCALGWMVHDSAGAETRSARSASAVQAYLQPDEAAPNDAARATGTGSSVRIDAPRLAGEASTVRSAVDFGPQGRATSTPLTPTTPAGSHYLPIVGLPPGTPTAPPPSAPPPPPAPAPANGDDHVVNVDVPLTAAPDTTAAVDPMSIHGAPSYIDDIFKPLPGAKTRGAAFSEWETYRVDVAGRDITVTTDDSNLWRDRNGKLNGNTGDTDASGLNVTDARNSTIFGSESADEAPYQTVAAALVDLASDDPGGGLNSDPDDDPADEDSDSEDPAPNVVPVAPPGWFTAPQATPDTGNSSGPPDVDSDTGDVPGGGDLPFTAQAVTPPTATSPTATSPPAPGASAIVTAPSSDDDGNDDSSDEPFDFPYVEWTKQISGNAASSVHTDEGTTLASGADALVVGADGYDDDDIRATGENIVVTRDDGNVVIGGNGDVNSQIGDSEQGAVIMNVDNTYIQGGGAY